MKNLEVRKQRYEDQERSENFTIRLNLFQHLDDDPKNHGTMMKTALLVNGPPSSEKTKPSFVPNHEPVLREERFFVPTLRVQVARSWNKIPDQGRDDGLSIALRS